MGMTNEEREKHIRIANMLIGVINDVNTPMLNSGDCKVVAWMHRDIPEPYRTESEE